MRISAITVLSVTLLSTGALAGPPIIRRAPTVIEDDVAKRLGFKAHFERKSQLSTAAKVKAAAESPEIHSIPYWSGSFNYQGVTYPYSMVGRSPQRGDTTRVATSLIPVSLVFDEFVDNNGNSLVIDVTPVLDDTLKSPDFVRSSYGTGEVQFGDAIQRAEFFNIAEEDWHTVLKSPRVLTPVTIEVPVGASLVFTTRSGVTLALVDANFFNSQLNTLIQLEPMRTNELAIVLSRNTLLYLNGDPSQCCVLGFHTAFEVPPPPADDDHEKQVRSSADHYVQTFAFASWLDHGIFSGGFEDVLPLSHEISEWLNDPFINNATPVWQFPDGSGACQDNLETGDPIEVLASSAYPVTLHGFTYHPQTEALFQWFTRESPSSAYHGAYSYPDMTALTKPSVACGQ